MVAKSNNGAGLSLTKSGADNPNPLQHGGMGQAERAFSAASTFLSGVMAISASQFIGAPLKLVNPKFYNEYMAWTKESFAILMTTITQWWSPTVIRVSGDESMHGQLYQMEDGTLKCNFPHRLVLMANHQLYTDWLYLWWIAYTNKMHGYIYIIMKESLKSLPIIGWSAQFYNFIFLSRKWETDRFRFRQALNHLKNPKSPMWLLIFPEGTNLSGVTREKSASWAKKSGVTDMKHQLLPRSTGLQFCLKELRSTTNWLYDCTVAYEGIPRGKYGQDVFTLRSSFFEGRPPKSVNLYWRRYRISEIPVDNDEAFGRWLNNRWREKDYLLEYYYKFGSFPAEGPADAVKRIDGKLPPNNAKSIATEVKGGGWDEFLSIFGPITSAAGALSAVDMTEPLNLDALMGKVASGQQMNLLNLGKSNLPATSQEAIRRALQAANKKQALPDALMDTLLNFTPQTQSEMKQVLQNSGHADVAKKAARAPGRNVAIPRVTQRNIDRTARSAQHAVDGARADSRARKSSNPVLAAKDSMPLANMQTMVTKPLSTYAIHTAASTVRNAAASRAKAKGSALPGQSTPAQKTSGTGSAKRPAQPANGVPKAPLSTVGSVGGSVTSKPTASVVSTPAKGKKIPSTTAQGTRASKLTPIGTQKYANGKVKS